jgi:alanine racemase
MKTNIDITTLQLIRVINGQCIQLHEPNTAIKQLLIDSRKLMAPQGAVFFAIKGKHHDGHNHINDLYQKGVRIFIVESLLSIEYFPEATFISVQSSITALQNCAASRREKFSIPIIAITGSNAKTIVKEWLSQLLSMDYAVVKSPRSYNSQVGVPISVWAINERHQMGIFEAGISTIHEMEALEKVIQPTIGIFTTIGSAHDEGFKDRIEKIKEKLQLFKHSNIVIYCNDQLQIANELQNTKIPTFTWSLHKHADVKYTLEASKGYQKEFGVIHNETKGHITIPFVDDASIENTLHVATTLLYLGYSIAEVSRKIAQLKPIEMRLELKEAIHNSYVIDDSYNNDLAGLTIALDFLDHVTQSDKKTLILSDVLESGLQAEALYKGVADILNAIKLEKVIAIGPEIKELKKWYKKPIFHFENTESFLTDMSSFSVDKEVILVKGARTFHFEKIVSQLQYKLHETVLEINLDALIHNLNVYRGRLKPNTKIMCMVKALSYGSGGFEIAQLLQYHGVNYLAVAYADEGAQLRENGITLPIMVMNPTRSSFDTLIQYQLEPEMYEVNLLNQLIDYAVSNERQIGIHLKVDTGMKRLGFEQTDIVTLKNTLKNAQANINVLSIFTHLAASDGEEHDAFTMHQLNVFDSIIEELTSVLDHPFLKHAVNSSGIMRFPQAHYDMVRLGIGLYGVESTGKFQHELLPISVFKTHISQIKEVSAHETVGYSRKGTVQNASKIATIAVGYADGYDRRFSNGGGIVSVNGVRCPIIGNVCMDMCMIDITAANAKVGDEVVLFGENPTASELANRIQTIPYEILTNVGARVKRIFYSA